VKRWRGHAADGFRMRASKGLGSSPIVRLQRNLRWKTSCSSVNSVLSVPETKRAAHGACAAKNSSQNQSFEWLV
jgi:hypothetical protein